MNIIMKTLFKSSLSSSLLFLILLPTLTTVATIKKED